MEQQQPPAQQMQQLNVGPRHPFGPQVVQQQPIGPQVVQQHPVGPQVVQQRAAGPQVRQQHPAGPQVVQQRPADPLNLQQQPASQGMQQPQGVWGSGMQQRQPGPVQQANQQQRHKVPQTAQHPQGMAQRPVAPQQSRPAVSQTQQSRPVAPQAAKPPVTAPQVPRLVAQGGALRPPSRKAAGGEGTLGRPIRLSANHFAVTMKKHTIYHYDVDVKPVPPKTLFK